MPMSVMATEIELPGVSISPRDGGSAGGVAENEVQAIRKLMAAKQFDKALRAIEALEQKQPRNADVLVLKGAAYLGMNDRASARRSYEQALAVAPSSAAATLYLARLDLYEKNTDAARRRLEGLIAADPTNADAMLAMARVAAATGDESGVVAWLQKAAAARPESVLPKLLIAEHYLSRSEPETALAFAQQAQTAKPDDPRVLETLGVAQLAVGDAGLAARTFGKWISIAPNDPVAHVKLATALAASKKMAAARASVRKALELKPDHLDAKIVLVAVELGSKQYSEALKTARTIQREHPASAAGLTLEGDVLMAQKQFAPALRSYEKAFALRGSGVLAIKVHQAFAAVGKPGEGEARLVQWLTDQPSDSAARLYLAEVYIKAGRNKEAIDQLERVVQQNPRNAKALNNLAWLYQQQKDPRALATIKQAHALKPEDVHILDTLGWILVEQGKAAEALPLLEKAADIAPASAAIQYHRAVALAQIGRKGRARDELERLLAKHPSFPERQAAETLLKQL
jgi:putative PEP-CTERM system TPR-repeat lipoprotein